MSSTAWKDLERRVCRMYGTNRRHTIDGEGNWAQGSDDDGTGPLSFEIKRTTRYSLRRNWIEQARRNAKATRRPWLLVIYEHHDPRGIVVLDNVTFAQIAQKAGLIGELPIE